jgi:two-component system chemotaxis family response regulator WspR
MTTLNPEILQQLIAGSAEPMLVARIDRPDWPVVHFNDAFASIAGKDDATGRPFADVVEEMIGRELALEVSESARAGEETTLPVEAGGRDFLLALKPLLTDDESDERYCAAYWRESSADGSNAASGEAQQALLKAKRRIRDLTRDDPVTGLINAQAFEEVLAHDWAVASREKSRLALVAFKLQDFDEYRAVFGKHATDSCQRRVAQAIRRCLRRASDVAARHGDQLVVLSHASDEQGVNEFAERIARAVRELGLHHPRSSAAKFVTVQYTIAVRTADEASLSAAEFLDGALNS